VSAYETVTADDLKVGDVVTDGVGDECTITRAVSHPGSTVWIQHMREGGTLGGTFGITHPFERLIVPAKKRYNVTAQELRAGDEVTRGPHRDKVVESMSILPSHGTVSVHFECQAFGVVFGELLIMTIEREVKS
tara:strand:- start:427 stop:828 length:402 start_codon:yes stop_codon:yes gene_type:complete